MLAMMHSVCGTTDYVCPWLAQALAVHTAFEVAIAEIGFQHGFADPRIPAACTRQAPEFWHEMPDSYEGDQPACCSSGDLPRGMSCPVNGASPRMDSLRGVEPYCANSLRAVETVTGATCNVDLTPVPHHSSAETCTYDAVVQSVHTTAGVCKFSERCPRRSKVRFHYTVTFWFPEHDQHHLSLPSRRLACVACSPDDGAAGPGPMPCVMPAPPVHAVALCARRNGSLEGGIPRLSAIPTPARNAAYLKPVVPTSPPLFHLPRSKARGKAAPFLPCASAASSSALSHAQTPEDAGVTDVVGEAVPVVEHSLLEGETPNPFTSFDELQGTRVFDWFRRLTKLPVH